MARNVTTTGVKLIVRIRPIRPSNEKLAYVKQQVNI